MLSRKKKLVINTATSLLLEITTVICGFVLPHLILHTYGSEVNGLVNSITQFLGIISFMEFGIGSVIQSALYKPLAEKDDAQISRIMVSGQRFFTRLARILVAYVVVLIIIYPVIANQNFDFLYTATLIAAMSISSFAQYYFGMIHNLLLTADQKGYVVYLVQTVTIILNTILCVVFIHFGASIHIVKLTTSLVYGLRPVFLQAYVHRNYHIDWNIHYDKEPIQQKWNGVAQHVAAYILDGTDNIVLTIFATLKDVSVYSVYYVVVNSLKSLFLSMTNGVRSLMGDLWARQEIKELRSFFGWVEWSLHTGTILIFGITSLLIVPFVEVYTYGVTDINYIQPVFAAVLVAAHAGHCLRLPYNLMILAGGHYKQTQSNYIIAAVMNVLISILAVRKWGLIGVAIGTLIAMCYQTVWMAWYNSKNLLCWPFRNFVKQVLIDAFCILLMHAFIDLPAFADFFSMQSLSYISWVILAIKVSIVCLVICFVLNFVFYRPYVQRLWKKAVERFHRH